MSVRSYLFGNLNSIGTNHITRALVQSNDGEELYIDRLSIPIIERYTDEEGIEQITIKIYTRINRRDTMTGSWLGPSLRWVVSTSICQSEIIMVDQSRQKRICDHSRC